jgi:hypothetical protein
VAAARALASVRERGRRLVIRISSLEKWGIWAAVGARTSGSQSNSERGERKARDRDAGKTFTERSDIEILGAIRTRRTALPLPAQRPVPPGSAADWASAEVQSRRVYETFLPSMKLSWRTLAARKRARHGDAKLA